MAEYIDKKEAMRRLEAAYDGSVAVHGDNDNLFADGIDYAMDIIGNIKAADAVPALYGEWIYSCDTDEPRCSECGNSATDGIITPYCPHCGANMEVINGD